MKKYKTPHKSKEISVLLKNKSDCFLLENASALWDLSISKLTFITGFLKPKKVPDSMWVGPIGPIIVSHK